MYFYLKYMKMKNNILVFNGKVDIIETGSFWKGFFNI